MAVKDDSNFHPTANLILAQPRRHLRTSVIPLHWQLRSIISCENGNYLYFPGSPARRKIIKLDPRTGQYDTLRVLQFSPRCLVSQNGWLCCGGESGEFVAVHLGSSLADNSSPPPTTATTSGPTSSSSSAASVLPILEMLDSRLPSSDSSSPTRVSEEALRSLLRSLHAPSQSFGKDRVNCITLWFPNDDSAGERAYKHPVAVLANNDKNVVFVSLKEGDCTAIDTVTYPDCVNRAVLSPDGTLCAAICDDPYLYINERVKKSTKEGGYEWVRKTRVHLKSQRVDDKSDNRGSFAVCFNNTGRFLAVGTQYGIISIFETAALLNPDADPLVTSFGSSRPHSDAGAVRDMAFCPGPFDLLAWTEDRGGVGVADIRRHYVSRQLLRVDKKDDFEHVDVIDRHAADYQRPSRDSRSERYESLPADASSPGIRDSIPADGPAEGRQGSSSLIRSQEADIRRLNSPLTREETLVLDAMREINRRRREALASDGPSNEGQGSGGGAGGDSNTVGRLPRERSASTTRNAIHSDYLRGVRVRLGDITSGGTGSGSSGASGPGSRLRAHGGYASELEAIYTLGFDPDAPDLRRDRDILFRPGVSQYNTLREIEERSLYARNPPGDDETAGMAWSEDGRILYVGAVNGIYEFHVNVTGRKLYPSITMR